MDKDKPLRVFEAFAGIGTPLFFGAKKAEGFLMLSTSSLYSVCFLLVFF